MFHSSGTGIAHCDDHKIKSDCLNMELILERVETFLLVLIRLLVFLSFMPLFKSRSLPRMTKIAISIVFAIVLFPLIPTPEGIANNAIAYSLLICKEIIVGIILGFATEFIFHGVRFAGHILGHQLGLAMASVLDPQTSEQISIIGQFKWLLAIMLFLAMEGHHIFLEAMAVSFKLIPLTGIVLNEGLVPYIIRLSTQIFVIAIQISAPVMAALIMTNMGMGLLARTLPQMNIFIVGFPLTIGIGLISIALGIPFFALTMDRLLGLAKNIIADLLKLLAP